MNENSNNNEVLNRLSSREVLMAGLELIFTQRRIFRVMSDDPWSSRTNLVQFKLHYGANPVVVAKIWEDLQTTTVEAARINNPHMLSMNAFNAFLESLNFLYRYRRECEREGTFDKSPKTLRKYCWYYLERIQALKEAKIVFPEQFGEDDIWIMTVDGTHSKTNEPIHPVFSQDKEYFSHKHKTSGLSYELGIHLFESKLIWMNGPIRAGSNDNGNFAAPGGLKEKLSAIGKMALADKAYNGHPKEISTFNAFDCHSVKQFKARAQMRHEQFNGMLKEFSCLHECFRHREQKFAVCFDATAVICQYRMENGEPLFNLLAGISLDEESDSSDDEESASDDDETRASQPENNEE